MLGEQQVLGLSPGDHIMTFYREKLRQHNILGSYGITAVPNGEWVNFAPLPAHHSLGAVALGVWGSAAAGGSHQYFGTIRKAIVKARVRPSKQYAGSHHTSSFIGLSFLHNTETTAQILSRLEGNDGN